MASKAADLAALLKSLGDASLDLDALSLKIQGETVIYDDETVRVASGTTAERPTPQTGMLRFNTTESAFEGYDGTAWGPLGGGEEGAWTPAYTTTGTGFDAVTYSVQVGRYVRTGDLVYVESRVTTSAITKGSASGDVTLSGLPFPVAAGDTTASANIGWSRFFLADHPISGLFIAGGSSTRLYKRATSVAGTVNIVVADMATGSPANDLILSGWYTTS